MRHPYIDVVRGLKPGEAITFSNQELRVAIPSFRHNGAVFTAADRVLENIVGSAYEYSYSQNHEKNSVTFYRHAKPSETPRYTSPDRR